MVALGIVMVMAMVMCGGDGDGDGDDADDDNDDDDVDDDDGILTEVIFNSGNNSRKNRLTEVGLKELYGGPVLVDQLHRKGAWAGGHVTRDADNPTRVISAELCRQRLIVDYQGFRESVLEDRAISGNLELHFPRSGRVIQLVHSAVAVPVLLGHDAGKLLEVFIARRQDLDVADV